MVLCVASFFALALALALTLAFFDTASCAAALTLTDGGISFFGSTLTRLKVPLSLDGGATG